MVQYFTSSPLAAPLRGHKIVLLASKQAQKLILKDTHGLFLSLTLCEVVTDNR